jgi:ubiquinone/menaquinone biosynthesis C-methylase UbiE
MTTKSPDLSETYISSERADVWHRAKARREETTGAATEMMLDFANIRVGDRVLGPNGHVLATDISASMLNRAAQAAREAGLTNVETHVMNAENLELDTSSFHAVICRSALMLFPNSLKALTSMQARREARREGCCDGAFDSREQSIPWIAAGDFSSRRKHGDPAA